MPLILGIHSGHDSSAALFNDGVLIAAASEERFTRRKNDGRRLPDNAINYVLSVAGAGRADVDHLALLYTHIPAEYFTGESFSHTLKQQWKHLGRKVRGKERPQLKTWGLYKRLTDSGKSFDDYFLKDKFLKGEGFTRASVRFYDHHMAHAWPAIYYSGFKKAAVITMDGIGDWDINHTSSIYEDGQLTLLHASSIPGTSAGNFYRDITRILGFIPNRHEGKITGLAAFGDSGLLYDAFARSLRISADGHTLDSEFAGKPRVEELRFNYLKQAIAGHRREDVAAAAQKVLEDVVVSLVSKFLDDTGMERLALNGGVFANVKLNQRIAELPRVREVFVFPGMSDTGNSVGAALMELASISPESFRSGARAIETVYLGPEHTSDEIEKELRGKSLSYTRLHEDEMIGSAAMAIHSGKVVGWFQGRMEFGPRALGNRSMLARPTKADINDWLNVRLERSEFMPFAPSVLDEYADQVVSGAEKGRHTAEFMTITFDVRPEWRERISAVVHVDGTARPQLVNKQTNPLYHRLISAYHELSGIPLVLNTSFNVHEEPIVCAPPEAIRAFVEKRVDCLAIGPFWLEHR